MSHADQTPDPIVPTGVPGLDDVLSGGLPAERLYLVEGDPGTGKTTLALQFLLEGVRRGERVLFVSLSESRDELEAVARSHGWNLEGIEVYELSTSDEDLAPDAQYTVFHPGEIELGERSRAILERVAQVNPARMVIDSLSELRLLARDSLRYRRQILALKQHLSGKSCTVLLLDDLSARDGDLQLQSICHGVLSLLQTPVAFGRTRRQLRVVKLRGVGFREGFHDLRLLRGGMRVFPALVAAEHRSGPAPEPLSSGIPAVDGLLGGGLDRGSSALFIGPAGTGKSVLALQYALAAARRGERAVLFAFDENAEILHARARGLAMDLAGPIEDGRLVVEQIDTAQLPAGEFVSKVRGYVEEHDARVVVIDSLNGFLHAMLDERFVVAHLHELVAYLNQRGVLTILLVAQNGLLGANMQTPLDVSYLADTVVLLRYFEAGGEVRKALSVLKKRTGSHESTIRELRFGPGIAVGSALDQFQGVLTGVPSLVRPMPPNGVGT